MEITAHILVKNEYRFIWYSVMSVLPFVDKVMIWDTGSTDGTIEIINEILQVPEAKRKVTFVKRDTAIFDEEVIRQEMLDQTTTDWFLVVDGDEIWWNESIKTVVRFIKENGKKYDAVVVPTINVIG
ncbi:glycosyltransferase, partial [Candidatus Woesebacteria bacterium]|nr:glycosyltransferase [Candidatus Woesebacteria bacterium]